MIEAKRLASMKISMIKLELCRKSFGGTLGKLIGTEGAFILWRWGDREIENSEILKTQLEEICSKGFSGVVAGLRASRYEVIDPKVVRAVTLASKMAKEQGVAFWFQTDPRQASRTLIAKKGERMQNLIVARKPEHGFSRKKLSITKVEKNRFEIKYEYPEVRYSSVIQDVSLSFDPSGLERTFLFQMEDGVVLRDSVRDITSVSHFFCNIAERYVEVFGEVSVPEGEEWCVVAFPRFDTNIYDYAGRASNDYLRYFVEDLFDAETYLDGTAWDDAGYVVDMGRFPVSLSLYNCFLAEYRYDLRDVLYELVLDVDDGSHVRVRCDYYKLLMNLVCGAQKEFYQMLHSFLGELDTGISHVWYIHKGQTSNLVRGNVDPWRSLATASIGLTEVGDSQESENHFDAILSLLVVTKSLGVFSKSKKAFCKLLCDKFGQEETAYWVDLMGLFSVRWLVRAFGYSGLISKEKSRDSNYPDHSTWKNFEEVNRKIGLISKLTNFRFPEANTALVFPVETIMAIGSQDADEVIRTVNRLIARLTLEGVHLDVFSPLLLKEGRISPERLRIRERSYSSVVFPYPEVLDPKVLEIVSVMGRIGFPILLGGSKPSSTSDGKKIPHVFQMSFDPRDEELSPLWNGGMKSLFKAPQNGIASMIQKKDESFFLICPKRFKGVVEGEVQYGEISFSVPRSSGLVIFRIGKDGVVEKVL